MAALTTALIVGSAVAAAGIGVAANQANKASKDANSRANDALNEARATEETRVAEATAARESAAMTPSEIDRENRLFGETNRQITQRTEDFNRQEQLARDQFDAGINQRKTEIAHQRRLQTEQGLPITYLEPEAQLAKELEEFNQSWTQKRQALETELSQLSSQSMSDSGAGLEKNVQSEVQRRAGLSGEELLGETGSSTQQLLDLITQRQGQTGEELFRGEGDITSQLADQILKSTQDPGGQYEDTLNQQLELARGMVNQEANRRGVFGGAPEGGLRFEQLGRAGVDLAISSARERESARQQDLANASALATQFMNLKQNALSAGADMSQAGIDASTQARAELQKFLNDIQMLNESSKNREVQGNFNALQFTDAARSQGTQQRTDVLGVQYGQAIAKEQAGLAAMNQGIQSLAGGISGMGGAPTGGTGMVDINTLTTAPGASSTSNLLSRSGGQTNRLSRFSNPTMSY